MVVLLLACALAADDAFASAFTGRAMRLDFFHTGERGRETIALERLRVEGPWPGSRTQLCDPLDLGKYFFEVADRATNRVIYSRGFASVFGEWETTGEAGEVARTFAESLRFPEPRVPVQVTLKKRAKDNRFVEIWSTVVDPGAKTVDRTALLATGEVVALADSGPPETKDDLLILGDGYTRAEKDKLLADARRLAAVLFAIEPFKSRARDFNVRVLFVPADESGVSRPSDGVWRHSPLGVSYDAFGVERYALTFDNRAVREIAAQAPYDHLEILMNDRKYGGGGIFNSYSTCASDTASAPYIFVHELGHHLAGLADEYYTSPVAYEEVVAPGQEPWEPNATALLDPAHLKWKDLVLADTPLPTPWQKEEYDSFSRAFTKERMALRARGAPESEMETLMSQNLVESKAKLGHERYAGKVGAFEGASYQAKGLYRPSPDCIMFTRNLDAFCPVCARAIERVIDLYAR
jgi:hypothetical protein